MSLIKALRPRYQYGLEKAVLPKKRNNALTLFFFFIRIYFIRISRLKFAKF